MRDIKKLLMDLKHITTQRTHFGNEMKNSDQKFADKLEQKIEQLPPKKKSIIKKILIKILVSIGYTVGDLIKHTLKEIISLLVQHFGKIVLAAVMLNYGVKITNSINKKVKLKYW